MKFTVYLVTISDHEKTKTKIGRAETTTMVDIMIHSYINDRRELKKVESPFWRYWIDDTRSNVTWVDFGSYSIFFNIVEEVV